MSAPRPHAEDRVTIPVKMRPRLAAAVHVLAEQAGMTDRQLIAAIVEDFMQRGPKASGKRHAIYVQRRALPRPDEPAESASLHRSNSDRTTDRISDRIPISYATPHPSAKGSPNPREDLMRPSRDPHEAA